MYTNSQSDPSKVVLSIDVSEQTEKSKIVCIKYKEVIQRYQLRTIAAVDK